MQVKELLKSKKYHGEIPPTKQDAKIGLNHLNRTDRLVDQKIADHDKAESLAKKIGNKQSAHYHHSHKTKHKEEKKKIKRSKRTINEIWNKLDDLRSKQ